MGPIPRAFLCALLAAAMLTGCADGTESSASPPQAASSSSSGQVEEVRAHYMGEDCPQDYPTPAPQQIAVTPEPDLEALQARLSAELEEYEAVYGPLEYEELNIYPPVFVRYYYEDGQPREDTGDMIRNYREIRLLIDPPGTV